MNDLSSTVLIIWHIIFGLVIAGGLILVVFGIRRLKKSHVSLDAQNQQNKEAQASATGGTVQIVIGVIMIIAGIIASIIPYFVVGS
jgi:hypothetical protein